jgi:hypothetical protein
MVGSFSRVVDSETQQDQSHYAYADLPPRGVSHSDGGIRHTLLGYQIVFLTLLGSLAAGAAGFFGGPLILDGGTTR